MPFEVRYSQLRSDALLNELKRRYSYIKPISCQLFKTGMNDVYVVKAEQNTYYLRISLTGMHERHDYEEELFIINSLGGNGIKVVTPVSCEDGSFVWQINAPEGIRYAVMFLEAEKGPSNDKVKMGYNLGQMVAQMHMIADENNYTVSRNPIDFTQLIKKPLKMIQSHLEHRSTDYFFLQNAAEELSKSIDDMGMTQRPHWGFCHGDVHAKNVCFDGNKPTLIDFDCMGYGWRAYDICVFAWYETLTNSEYIKDDACKAYIEGYKSVRQLDGNELSAINAFSALREFWLMGHHADLLGRNEGSGWYNDGDFDFHIGNFKLWYKRFYN